MATAESPALAKKNMSEERRFPYPGDAPLEGRVYSLEIEMRYLKQDIERQFKTNREYMDQKFSELQRSMTLPASAQELRDPRAWLLVIAGVIGGGVIFIVALLLATRGFG